MNKLFTIFCLISLSLTEDGPVWPNKFQQDFSEKMSYSIFTGTTNGTIYYDFQNLRYRIDRENGKFDRYCGSVYKLTSTPCNHYVVDNMRYLHFPKKNHCCACCDSEHGCGVLKPDWMKDGTKIEEYEKDGKQYQTWNKPGLQDNTMTVVKKGEFWVMTQINQKPNDLMNLNPDSQTCMVDDKVFNLPDGCSPTKRCTKFSICGAIQSTEI